MDPALGGDKPGQSLCCEVGSEGAALTGHPPRTDSLALSAVLQLSTGIVRVGDVGEEEERTLSPS